MLTMIMVAVTALVAVQGAVQPAASAAPPAAPDYAQDAAWLCLPGRTDDACGEPLPTAALDPAGYGPVTPSSIANNPPVDCFYVYPTVSRDPGINSDLTAGDAEEKATARIQLARFASLCRTFAPIYRSVTNAGLFRALGGSDPSAGFGMAYGDVRDAWRQFLASRTVADADFAHLLEVEQRQPLRE